MSRLSSEALAEREQERRESERKGLRLMEVQREIDEYLAKHEPKYERTPEICTPRGSRLFYGKTKKISRCPNLFSSLFCLGRSTK